MQRVTTIGLDIAKSVFQVHGIDATGKVVIRCLGSRGFRAWLQKDLARREICPCGWAAELGQHYRVVHE